MIENHLIVMKYEDGDYLAISISKPRFCVSGSSYKEACEKAQRAMDYYKEFNARKSKQ